MNAWKGGLLGFYAFSSLLIVASVGKRREPITPRVAVITLLVNAALAFVVVQA